MITDTHAHVYWKDFEHELDQLFERSRAAGVARVLVVGTTLETSRSSFELAARFPGVFPTAGIHPNDAQQHAHEREAIRTLVERVDCVAVGETGLDWFRTSASRAAQLDNFDWHVRLADELDKPLIVHCREAHTATVAALERAPRAGGVMHCYSLGPAELAPYLERGFYISFAGILTYPKNGALREAAQAVPAERLLVETDCPFLAPQDHRGQRNEPAYVTSVVAELARLRGTTFAEMARQTSVNAARLFRLPPL